MPSASTRCWKRGAWEPSASSDSRSICERRLWPSEPHEPSSAESVGRHRDGTRETARPGPVRDAGYAPRVPFHASWRAWRLGCRRGRGIVGNRGGIADALLSFTRPRSPPLRRHLHLLTSPFAHRVRCVAAHHSLGRRLHGPFCDSPRYFGQPCITSSWEPLVRCFPKLELVLFPCPALWRARRQRQQHQPLATPLSREFPVPSHRCPHASSSPAPSPHLPRPPPPLAFPCLPTSRPRRRMPSPRSPLEASPTASITPPPSLPSPTHCLPIPFHPFPSPSRAFPSPSCAFPPLTTHVFWHRLHLACFFPCQVV